MCPPTRPNVQPAPGSSSRSMMPITLSQTLPDEEITMPQDATMASALDLAPVLDPAQTHLLVAMETPKRRCHDPSLATSKEAASASRGAHSASEDRQRLKRTPTSLAVNSSATSLRRCSGMLHPPLVDTHCSVSDFYPGNKAWLRARTTHLQANSGP